MREGGGSVYDFGGTKVMKAMTSRRSQRSPKNKIKIKRAHTVSFPPSTDHSLHGPNVYVEYVLVDVDVAECRLMGR